MNNPYQHPNDQAQPFFEPILEYYNNLPPITRAWFSVSLLITTLNTLDVLPDYQLIFMWDRLQSPHLELWRIVTSFTWAGPGTLVDFPVLILLYSMIVSVSSYEMDPHEAGRRSRRRNRHHTQSDCLFAFLCCSLLIVGSYLLITETNALIPILHAFDLDQSVLQPLFTRTLEYAILTLDSFRNPDRQVNINFFPVQGRLVPLFHLGFGLAMGYRINETVHGILVACVYLLLITEDSHVASFVGRKRIIFTPQWLLHLTGEEMDRDIPQEGPPLEEGANILHRAAASNDLSTLRRQLEQLESMLNTASSPAEVAAASAPFRQQDVNGWQPLHEAARAGHKDVIKLLLEIDDNHEENLQNRTRAGSRRGNKLKVNVNSRTNNGRGVTALWLANENHGVDSDISLLLRNSGGISIGYGDGSGELDGESSEDSESD